MALSKHLPISLISRGLVVICAVSLLVGCAAVRDMASQTPIISMFYDYSDAKRLVNSIDQDDSLSDEEIRVMMSRPIPSPPGISYEVGLLRRAAAATSLGEVKVVEDMFAEGYRHRISEPMLAWLAELVVESNALSGDILRARKLALKLEKNLRNAARQAGQPGYAWVADHLMLYHTMLAIATGLGDRNMYTRLMSEYPESLRDIPKTTAKDRQLYELTRITMPIAQLIEEGDYEAAIHAGQLAKQASKVGEQSGDIEDTTPQSRWIELDHSMVIASSLLRKPATAKQHLDSIHALVKSGGDRKPDRAKALDAAAMYLASIGQHEQALHKLMEAWGNTPRFYKIAKVVREGHFRNMARLQVATGLYGDAMATLDAMGPLDAISIKYYRESAIAIRAYARAAMGEAGQDLHPLDDIDAEMRRRIGTDAARFHFAVKTYANHTAFRASRAETNLRQAVMGGRAFAQSYRHMRATGQFGAITMPPSVYANAKAAYLLATLSAVGKYDVGVDDILDALSLYYESDIDEDIAAAAFRTNIPGLTATEVRALQDLRVAARKAAKHLEVVGKQGETRDIEAAASDMERAAKDFGNALKGLEAKSPRIAQALVGSPPKADELRALLGQKEALMAVAPTELGTVALILTPKHTDFRILPIKAGEIRDAVAKIRISVELDTYSGLPLRPFDIAASARLYEALVAWAEPALKGIDHLSIVASGDLAGLPFGLLTRSPPSQADYRTVPWLIKRFAITHVPTVTAWKLSVSGTANRLRKGSFLAWAEPDFGGTTDNLVIATRSVRHVSRTRSAVHDQTDSKKQLAVIDLSPIVGARAEAEGIARALQADPVTSIYSGRQATRRSVSAASDSGDLQNTSIVMFATHGLAPGDIPGLNQPALAMALDPTDTSPPLLSLEDVMHLRTGADWLLMSACQTSAGERGGSEPLSGLARGFFFAGAKGLLVTHWPVENTSAASFTTRTINHYVFDDMTTRAQAVQRASVDMITGSAGQTDWAHPAYWAAFALIGSGQR